MLSIRKQQMNVLRQAAVKSFEDRVVRHLNEFFPEECRRTSETQIRDAIRQGIAHARAYGIDSEIDVARYIDLSVVLGLDFDSGRLHPWVPQILKNENLQPDAKVQLIFERVRRMRAEAQSGRTQRG